MRSTIALCLSLLAAPVHAVDLQQIVDTQIVPGYRDLAQASQTMAEAAKANCAPDDASLREAYAAAFDKWIMVSHLRFGPSEVDDRAFALAFWPDTRGATPKALTALIQAKDPIIKTADGLSDLSIAARGFYALEFLLYDPAFTEAPSDYSCALIQALTIDIARTTGAILRDWTNGYATLLSTQGNDTYRTDAEAQRQLFTALTTGLEFTSGTRLGRPLGTIDKPRPARAEARRSKRSQRHVVLSLTATRDLALALAIDTPGLAGDMQRAFDRALARAETLEDPGFVNVDDPAQRFRLEALKQQIDDIRTRLIADLGPSLGVTVGFNSLDGD